MRRDNPHISKRRGGRAKTGHRKFSLQAFHAKHLGGHHTHSSSSTTTSNNQQNQSQNQSQNHNQNQHHQRRSNKDDINGATHTQIEIHDAAANDKSFVVDHKKLPVVEENELRHGSGEEVEIDTIKSNNREQMVLAVSLSNKSNTKLSALGKLGANEQRRVRVDDQHLAESNLTNTTNNNNNSNGVITNSANLHYRHHHQQQQHNIRHQIGPGSHPQHHHRCHHHHNHHHHHHQQQQHHQLNKNLNTNDNHKTGCKNNSSAVPTPADPTSTSSACVYYDDDTLILNDSQSSENVSPQRQSSFVCSQSSIHREDSSLN